MRWALSAVIALAACDSTSSVEVPTSEIGMQAFATAQASGEIEIRASLTTTNPALLEVTYINLEEGDELYANLGQAELKLREEYIAPLGIYRYTGSLVDPNPGELTIDFRRAVDVDAPSSTVTLPSPFTIDSPPVSHDRGSPLDLAWSVSGEVPTTRVLVSGDCIAGSEVRIDDDPGAATVPASAFEAPSGVDPSLPCSVLVQVDRLSEGTVDEAYGRGGRIEAAQTRSFNLDVILP